MPAHEVIRIDDLVAPVHTEDQRAVLDYMNAREVDLAPASITSLAAASSGLSDPDFEGADPTVRDRLAAYLGAVDADTGLTGLGRAVQQNRAVRMLASRALLNDLLARHPEIREIELEKPLIVVGLPRSGTTHLVNLLAADTRRRSLPYWESQEVFPRRGEGPGPNGIDPRYQRIKGEHEVERNIAPLAQNMHDRFPEAIEEECEIMDLDFCSYTLEWHIRGPAWRDFYLGLDHGQHYAYLRTVLQALTFLRGPASWVLKSPQHLEQLGSLIKTFPDATVAFTHRDPVAVIQSAITMLAYGDRMRRHAIEPDQLRDYWVDRIERILRATVADRDLIPADQSIDIFFHEFMKDDMAVVQQLYDRAGVELTTTARRQMDAYVDANPRGKHGQIAYDLAGDFGVEPDAVRERFGFYLDRFPVMAEN